MVLLIDANIILDVLMNRNEFVIESSLIWKYCETHQAKGYISALTIANLVYIMRKELDPKRIDTVISSLKMIFEIANLTSEDIILASKMQWRDFEDALQTATNKRIQADYIITRNVKDFRSSKVPAFTPSELLERI